MTAKRLAPLAFLSLTGASDGPQAMPSVIEAGRVAATLTDWQTITYFLIFLLVVQTVERIVGGWQNRSTSAKVADALDRFAAAMQLNSTDVKVQLALIQQSVGARREP